MTADSPDGFDVPWPEDSNQTAHMGNVTEPSPEQAEREAAVPFQVAWQEYFSTTDASPSDAFYAGWAARAAGRAKAVDEANAFGYREGHQTALAADAERIEELEGALRALLDCGILDCEGVYPMAPICPHESSARALLSSKEVESS